MLFIFISRLLLRPIKGDFRPPFEFQVDHHKLRFLYFEKLSLNVEKVKSQDYFGFQVYRQKLNFLLFCSVSEPKPPFLAGAGAGPEKITQFRLRLQLRLHY